MFGKFANFLNEKLSGPMTKLANQRHLRAIRDGIIATLPLIIVGSFFLIIANPPLPASWGISQFLTANAAKILLPYRMSMYIMTLYAVFGIGNSLAKSYDLDGMSGAILAEIAYLLTITPVNVSAKLEAGVSGFVIPMSKLGSAGMFVGIVTAILAVEIYRFMSVISIDIGGTKTKAVLYDEQGQSLQEISLPSCHFMNAKEEEIKIRLQQCILDPQADIVIGYAGYARNEDMGQLF